MRSVIFAAIIVSLWAAAAVAQDQAFLRKDSPGLAGEPLCITQVTVLDTRTGALTRDRSVVIRGDRITRVAPSADVDPGRCAQVVDGTRRYLIPGLWDMHVHSAANVAWHFPLFIALGITGVRNMHTSVDTALELTQAIKRRVANGSLPGPRFIANGPVVDGPVPVHRGSVALGTPAAARAAVDSLAAGGADFIKVYDRLPRDVYFAIADQAKQRGIPFVGHVPTSVRVAEAADAGQRSIEHPDTFFLDCSSVGDSIRSRMATNPPSSYQEYVGIQAALARTWNPGQCAPAIRALLRNGTWVMPDLAIPWAAVYPDSLLNDSAVRAAVPPDQLRRWSDEAHASPEGPRETDKAILTADTAMVSALHRAGVPLLAGTDLGNSLVVPGYSLHKELELLVGAGLTPLEALRTATLNPARFLEATDSLGTVAPGKLADLVLLDANPLEDIRNTMRIAAVVLAGRLFDRAALDKLVATARKATARESAY